MLFPTDMFNSKTNRLYIFFLALRFSRQLVLSQKPDIHQIHQNRRVYRFIITFPEKIDYNCHSIYHFMIFHGYPLKNIGLRSPPGHPFAVPSSGSAPRRWLCARSPRRSPAERPPARHASWTISWWLGHAGPVDKSIAENDYLLG